MVASRWLHFTSMAALFGGALFWLLVARPADPSAVQRLIRVAAPIAAISGAGWALATIATIAGDPGLIDPQMLHAFFLETPFGPIVAVRLALLGVVVAIAFAPLREKGGLVAMAATAGVLLISQAWLGHAATGGDTPRGIAMIVAYACHVLAAAAWVGALPSLWLALRAARGRGADPWRLLRRVSTLATPVVVLLVVAGVANATFRIGRPADLVTTAYGQVLLVKLGLTGAMLALAAGNRAIVATGRGSAWLRSSVAAELGLGVLVLGMAAVLGITPPPH